MSQGSEKIGIARALAMLRKRVLASEPDAYLGNEDSLMAFVGTSRGTLRQIARVLEREGLIEVRRGASGGYYARHPDLDTIAATVSGYLHTLEVKSRDATLIASVLWVETLRRAAQEPVHTRQRIADEFMAKLATVAPEAPHERILEFELAYRQAIFELVGSRYVQLIFQINSTFAQGQLGLRQELTDAEHGEFVRCWRNAKLLELAAIANGDADLAANAAARGRSIWQERVSPPDPMDQLPR